MDGGRAVAMAILLPPPTKPITLPWQRGFSGGGTKEEYAKPLTEGRGVTYGKIGLTTVAIAHDLLTGIPLVLLKKEHVHLGIGCSHPYPDPGQPSAQLFKLIRLTAWNKTKHTASRWYRIVYILAQGQTLPEFWSPPSHRGLKNHSYSKNTFTMV